MRRIERRTLLRSLTLALALSACGGSYQSAWDESEDTQQTTQGSETSQNAEQLIAQGDEAWTHRDEEAQVQAAITAWEQAIAMNANDADTWVKLSRGYYFLAHGHQRWSNPDAMLETYQRGIRAADRALVALSPEFAARMRAQEPITEAVSLLQANAVPALYWRASNLGRWARLDGFATVLSYKDEIRAVMTRCMELDRYYFFAGPDRYFGAFFAIAPSYAGGDLDRSQQHFDESIRRAPAYVGTHVLYAENLSVKRQDRASFVEHLQMAIDADPEALPEAAPENRIEQRLARELLEQADELFE